MGAPIQQTQERLAQLKEAMNLLCESSLPPTNTYKNTPEEDDEAFEESFKMEELIASVHCILGGSGSAGSASSSLSNASLKELDECFSSCNQHNVNQDQQEEFNFVEEFVLTEQNNTRARRKTARKLEASEEKRLAIEVAQLKGIRLKSQRQNHDDELRLKISDAERSYVSRKMIYADASRKAGSELRVQFASVRTFLEDFHRNRQRTLLKQHRRTVVFQAFMHSLRGTDKRVVALDRQISNRLYRKKKYDLNEYHMQQTLEEAVYLESMMNILDQVQTCKENAARDLFEFHIENFKTERRNNSRRDDEFALFVASATLEKAKLVAQYTALDADDQEREAKIQQRVDAMERSKNFKDLTGGVMSVGKLYDTILWSVANTDLNLTTTGSSYFSSDYGDGEEGVVEEPVHDQYDEKENETEQAHQQKCLTPIGKIHQRQLARDLKIREQALIKKHENEVKAEKHEYLKASYALKAKHQDIIDALVESSLVKREHLRFAITERMEGMARRQKVSTEQMRKNDVRLMKEALLAEDRRLGEVETTSFMKAQELISAQVFHEVRNALSSVIAMSEITDSMKQDESMTAHELVRSVDDMLDQISDVVNYALKMLNEILDVSKINSGAFLPHNEAFDLNDIVARATRMQQAKAKASCISMSFSHSVQPIISVSDSGIVERIVATLISNAIKFTSSGAVQSFVWPIESISNEESEQSDQGSVGSEATISTSTGTCSTASMLTSNTSVEGRGSGTAPTICDKLPLANTKMKMVAVGVADTGMGLTKEVLDNSKFVISTYNSKKTQHGAQNTGFGLYHAHLQARALNTHLRLANVDDCHEMLNQDFLNARKIYEQSTWSDTEMKLREVPGKGTILYFTLPVYEDGDGAAKALQACIEETSFEVSNNLIGGEYTFKPSPAPDSKMGSFRILVADDVLMLRKGLVHTIGKLWGDRFPDCPVSISTACTAEDVLRAAASEPYDMIICDHLFNADLAKLNAISPEDLEIGGKGRSHIRFDSISDVSQGSLRNSVKEFFAHERFTIEKDDGTLLGLNALKQLAESTSSPFPLPILMLVSGHKIDVKEGLGIIIAQKPLKNSEFISSLESHAVGLLRAGRCHQIIRNSDATRRHQAKDTIFNGHGSQVFIRNDKDEGGAPRVGVNEAPLI